MLYNCCLRNVPLRSILFWVTLACSAATLTQLILVTGGAPLLLTCPCIFVATPGLHCPRVTPGTTLQSHVFGHESLCMRRLLLLGTPDGRLLAALLRLAPG